MRHFTELKELRVRDYVELMNLMRLGHHVLLRANFLLRRADHRNHSELRKINQLIWKQRKIFEREVAGKYLAPLDVSYLKSRHRRPQNAEINLFIKY